MRAWEERHNTPIQHDVSSDYARQRVGSGKDVNTGTGRDAQLSTDIGNNDAIERRLAQIESDIAFNKKMAALPAAERPVTEKELAAARIEAAQARLKAIGGDIEAEGIVIGFAEVEDGAAVAHADLGCVIEGEHVAVEVAAVVVGAHAH